MDIPTVFTPVLWQKPFLLVLEEDVCVDHKNPFVVLVYYNNVQVQLPVSAWDNMVHSYYPN